MGMRTSPLSVQYDYIFYRHYLREKRRRPNGENEFTGLESFVMCVSLEGTRGVRPTHTRLVTLCVVAYDRVHGMNPRTP